MDSYVIIASDSYIMEPYKERVNVQIKKREEIEEYHYWEEDLTTGPSLFEQMMKGVKEEDNSDDDEVDENENPVIKEKT